MAKWGMGINKGGRNFPSALSNELFMNYLAAEKRLDTSSQFITLKKAPM